MDQLIQRSGNLVTQLQSLVLVATYISSAAQHLFNVTAYSVLPSYIVHTDLKALTTCILLAPRNSSRVPDRVISRPAF